MCGAGASVTPASRGGGSCGPPPIATTRAWSGSSLPPLACRTQQTALSANFYGMRWLQVRSAAAGATQAVTVSGVGGSAAAAVCVTELALQDTIRAVRHSSYYAVCAEASVMRCDRGLAT
jgi:hypothetical protein